MTLLKAAAFTLGFFAVAFVMMGIIALWVACYYGERRR